MPQLPQAEFRTLYGNFQIEIRLYRSSHTPTFVIIRILRLQDQSFDLNLDARLVILKWVPVAIIREGYLPICFFQFSFWVSGKDR